MTDDKALQQMHEVGEEVGPAQAVYLHQIRVRVTLLIIVGVTFTIVLCAYMYQTYTDQVTRDCRTYVAANYSNVQANYLATLGETVDQGIVSGDLSDDKLEEFRSYLGDDGFMRAAGGIAGQAAELCPSYFWPGDSPDRTPPLPPRP